MEGYEGGSRAPEIESTPSTEKQAVPPKTKKPDVRVYLEEKS
jgi:hypothetical protein